MLSRLRYLKHFATSLPLYRFTSYTIALFANVLFVFICVWTLDGVHARLRLPFLTLQQKRFDVATKAFDFDVS